jgi:hypothetical protein
MADLGFFESLALGMIAGDTVTRDWPRLAAEAGAARRLRNEASAQEQVVGALIAENEHLRASFNVIAQAAERVQRDANAAAQENAQLRQELAAAKERGRQAEVREAETQKALDHANAKIRLKEEFAAEDQSEINRLLIENSQLKRR